MGRAEVELRWPGKYGPDGLRVEAPERRLPLAVSQQVGPGGPDQGLLICADNLLAMDALMPTHEGRVDLVYIDPPFATGHAFERATRVGAEGPELRTYAYCDRWPGGLAGFLQMLDPRLRRIHRLLAPHGSLYVHVDPTVGHAVKLLLDEVFGPECFQREIVWRIGWVSGFKASANNWIRNHDLIFFYVKDPRRFVFHRQVLPHPAGYRRRRGAGTKQGGVPAEDVWNASPAEWRLAGGASLDSIQIKSLSQEKTGWATQKNESLLRRIVAASSDPGALVADFFCGAGTTLAAAQALGRRWIGCDSAAAAVELAHARLARAEGASFVRCGLGAGERAAALAEQAAAWPALALQLRGAAPAGARGLGRAGEAAVLVGPLDAALGRGEVEAAAQAAAGLGLRRLEALAWTWAFPAGIDLSAGTGVEVICYQLQRALLDRRLAGRRELLWSERPAPSVVFTGEEGPEGRRVQAELVELGRSAGEGPLARVRGAEPVEAWAIALGCEPGVFRADHSSARARRERALATRTGWLPLPGEGPWTARARIVDALGGETWHRWCLRWSEGQLVAEATGDG